MKYNYALSLFQNVHTLYKHITKADLEFNDFKAKQDVMNNKINSLELKINDLERMINEIKE